MVWRRSPVQRQVCRTLALITVMQFAEGLSDRAAADAVRSRIDWKYALNLELTDPGFHYSVLAKFRKRLGSWPHLVRSFLWLLEVYIDGRFSQRTNSLQTPTESM